MRGGVCCLVGSGLGTWMAEEVLSSFLSSEKVCFFFC